MSTYYAQADHLERRYREALGWALQFRIATHTGGCMRSLGDLTDDIYVHRARYGLDLDGQPLSLLSAQEQMRNLLQVNWLRGHQVTYSPRGPRKYPWFPYAATIDVMRERQEREDLLTQRMIDYYGLSSQVTRETIR